MITEDHYLNDIPPGSLGRNAGAPLSALDRIGLDGIWVILRRHLWLMALVVTLVIALTVTILNRVPAYFTARATLVLTVLDTRISQTDVQLESYELSRAIVETELDVLKSREFAAQVAGTLSLYDNADFLPRPEGATEADEALHVEQVIDRLLSSYTVYRDGESLAIDIIVETTNPTLAADIANTLSETYIANTEAKQRDTIERSIILLRDRVADLAEELTVQERNLADFIRNNELDAAQLPERLRSEVHYLTSMLKSRRAEGGSARELAALQDDLSRVESALQARTQAELTKMRMDRLLELQRARYQTAISRLNELENHSQFVAQGARQVSLARPPVTPSWPNIPVALAISAVCALFLAIVAAMMVDLMNRRLRSEEQTMQVSNVPNVGNLPRFTKRIFFRPQPSVVEHLVHHPRSMFSHSVRGATTPWFGVDHGWVAMITSGLPDEGKSTVAVALSVSAALDGLKVLLLDLDARRMGATALIDPKNKPVSLLDVVQDVAQPQPVMADGEPIEGLEYLTIDPDATCNLKDQRQILLQLRNMLRWDYDLVVVDTPPILVLDDTRRFGVLADEIWQVVRWNHTTETVLGDAMERLKQDGLPVAAIIINDIDTKRHSKKGYGGYAQYYAHGAPYYK